MDVARPRLQGHRPTALRLEEVVRAKDGERDGARVLVYDAARPAGLGTLQVDEWVLDVPDVDPLLGSFGRVSGGCCVERIRKEHRRGITRTYV